MTTDSRDNANNKAPGTKSETDTPSVAEPVSSQSGPAGSGGAKPTGGAEKRDYKAAIAKLRQPIRRESAAETPAKPGAGTSLPRTANPPASHHKQSSPHKPTDPKPHATANVHVAPASKLVHTRPYKAAEPAGTPARHGPAPVAEPHPVPETHPILTPRAQEPENLDTAETVAAAILDGVPEMGTRTGAIGSVSTTVDKHGFERLDELAKHHKPLAPADSAPDPIAAWRDLAGQGDKAGKKPGEGDDASLAAPAATENDAETGPPPVADTPTSEHVEHQAPSAPTVSDLPERTETAPDSDAAAATGETSEARTVEGEPAGEMAAEGSDDVASEDDAQETDAAAMPAADAAKPKRRHWSWPVRIVAVIVAIPVAVAALVYARLLFGPIDLTFIRPNVEQAVRDSLPPDSAIELGQLSLSISANFSPVLHFEPVTFTDNSTGASVGIDALEIGVSPLQTLIGQPAAVVTLVNPRLQILQDLLGPRLASFTESRDPETGEIVVEVQSGRDTYPEVRIGADGLQLSGPPPRGDGIGLRSDNDWLIYNFDAMEQSIIDLETQAREGRFARLQVRGGSMEFIDPVMSIVRRFDDLEARIVPGAHGQPTTGTLGAVLAGRTIAGRFSREDNGGGASQLKFSFDNLDFSALMPALDDPDALLAVKGGGGLSGVLDYAPGGEIEHGQFDIDLTGTELRLSHDYFGVGAGRFSLDWNPKAAQFQLHEGVLSVGKSTTRLSGEFALGLDDVYGPMVAMSLKLKDLALAPNDMNAPESPFSVVDVMAWSAPLYGTIGIDRMVATKPGVEIRAKGRFDLVRRGIGVDLEVAGEGASADDLKRLWPYFIARGGREWFVDHIVRGRMTTGSLRFKLPVGVLDPTVGDQPLPPNTAFIDLVGSDVTLIPTEGFKPVALGGDAKLTLRDNRTSVTIASTRIVSDQGQFTFANGAVQIDAGDANQTVVEFSGDVNGQIPALIGFAESQSPGVVEGFGLPFDARRISGRVDGSAVLTLTFGDGPAPLAVDYAVNGTTLDFASTDRIADRLITDGQLSFQATPDAYHVTGTAALDGVAAELVLDGGGDAAADIKVASTIDVAEFESFGFDFSELMSGRIRFVAKPLDNGGMQIAADLTEARLNLKDVGLGKQIGIPGTVNAEIHTEGTLTKVTKIDLGFASVRVVGALDYDSEEGLVSADFSEFALSEGDAAQLTVVPGEESGYKVTLTGDQFDLKPMLKRYFALDQTSTGSPQATSVPEELNIDANLKRAIGFYGVTAYNVEFGLDLKGEDLLDASLQAQFTDGNTVSLTSNPTNDGRLMTVAFNDVGTVLRFLNVYPRLLGGSGSLTLKTDARQRIDFGEIRLRDFAIVDEARVAEILGNHKDSRKLIANENRLNFQNAQASFVRRSDRIELTDAVLDGGTIGGTLKGFIYTKSRQYDLTGTYIPLFGLNNLFQKLPIIGQILGGREGEGLVGVTYAVRGELDNPEFIVNPASILAPGIFRSLFEFRATEAPREATPQQ